MWSSQARERGQDQPWNCAEKNWAAARRKKTTTRLLILAEELFFTLNVSWSVLRGGRVSGAWKWVSSGLRGAEQVRESRSRRLAGVSPALSARGWALGCPGREHRGGGASLRAWGCPACPLD